MDVAEHAQKVIDLLNKEGWIQGYTGGPKVGYCLVGAIHTARMGDATESWSTIHPIELERRLVEILGVKDIFHLSEWNDDYGRTKEEVINALKRAKES